MNKDRMREQAARAAEIKSRTDLTKEEKARLMFPFDILISPPHIVLQFVEMILDEEEKGKQL